MTRFDKVTSLDDIYGPAMLITDEGAAAKYFEEMVDYAIGNGMARQKAEKDLRDNLGYYAGYYDNETRERVERLFKCEHPIFGAIKTNGPPTAAAALAAGFKLGQERDDRSDFVLHLAVRRRAKGDWLCQVCQLRDATAVVSSAFGAISHAYCVACIILHFEPIGFVELVATELCGGWEKTSEELHGYPAHALSVGLWAFMRWA